MSLDLHLDVTPGLGLRRGLEEALRNAIRSGRLCRGTRLPATRALARDIGVSRGTVLNAYAQLAAEGWIAGSQGSATIVVARPVAPQVGTSAPPTPQPRYDMRPVAPDPSSFPRAEWLRALRRALKSASNDVLGYSESQGLPRLRTELAAYLSRVRGLQVSSRNVIVTTGYTQSLNLIVRAFTPSEVAIEEPSISEHRAIIRSAGHSLRLIPVDAHGVIVHHLGQQPLFVITPNQQYPLGYTLGTTRRAELLDWARPTHGYVLENDYDGEFRYDQTPLAPLQGLEPSRVIYGGTASKSLSPGLRLGWLVVPDELVDRIVEQKRLNDHHNAALDKIALAEFLSVGDYDRHLRKQRLRYRRRRDLLLEMLPNDITIIGSAAGLSLTVLLEDASVEAAILEATRLRGIAVNGLASGGYYENDPIAGLVIGYGAQPEHAYQPAVAELADCIGQVLRR